MNRLPATKQPASPERGSRHPRDTQFVRVVHIDYPSVVPLTRQAKAASSEVYRIQEMGVLSDEMAFHLERRAICGSVF
jgi:hypothetical protein